MSHVTFSLFFSVYSYTQLSFMDFIFESINLLYILRLSLNSLVFSPSSSARSSKTERISDFTKALLAMSLGKKTNTHVVLTAVKKTAN
jgi:hypothetical protein